MAEPQQEMTVEEWLALLDKDEDGHLTVDKVKTHFANASDSAALLIAMGARTIDEAVTRLYEVIDTDKDGKISREELRRGFGPLKMRGQLCMEPTRGLIPHNFFRLWHEKRSAHLEGTREWAFAEVQRWLDDAASAQQLFWLMGGGGTGKSVLTAALLERLFGRVAAWHFCRHDNPQASAPAALLRSLAAMLCHRLPGYAEALGDAPAETVTDPKELFEALFATPLAPLAVPAAPLLLIVDALAELPREAQKPLLAVIAGQLSQLPPWLRLFVTSREEAQIQAAFRAFKAKELRADEEKNRADVAVSLRKSAAELVESEVRMTDIEADVLRTFGIDMKGEMAALQEPMDRSREIYRAKRTMLEARPGYAELLEFPEQRPDPVQASDEFAVVRHQAAAAQRVLTAAVATKWEADPGKATLRHPAAQAATKEWIEMADDPGVKGEERARQKMANDYAGHANRLKDLARLTLRFTQPATMVRALRELPSLGIKIVVFKNKYAQPTPMGYSDINLVVEIPLPDGTPYLGEMQLNLDEMLAAKKEAHSHYEVIRTRLPELCKGTKVDAEKLENYITGRLNTSALDAAVAVLSAKAEGLFLYAHLLTQHLANEKRAGRTIDFASLDSLPAGLSEVYAANFARAFPKGAVDPAWAEVQPLVELIAAAAEPITVGMAEALLDWDSARKERVLEATGLLFPVRDGKFHVFHKTVVDWLTGEIAKGSSVKERSEEFAIERRRGHVALAAGAVVWLDAPDEAGDEAAAAYWLRHAVVHLCRAGEGAKAAAVYAGDLALLRRRLDAGLLGTVAKDHVELQQCEGVDLAVATQMRRFVGKYTDVLQREGATALMQLAAQQPDASAVFRACSATRPPRTLGWRNKPQQNDPCIATLAQPGPVAAVAVSHTRLVVGAGKAVRVYDRATEELLEEWEGASDVNSVDVYEAEGSGAFVAGYGDGTLRIWGEPLANQLATEPRLTCNRTALQLTAGVLARRQMPRPWLWSPRRLRRTARPSSPSRSRPLTSRSCPPAKAARSKFGMVRRQLPQITSPWPNLTIPVLPHLLSVPERDRIN